MVKSLGGDCHRKMLGFNLFVIWGGDDHMIPITTKLLNIVQMIPRICHGCKFVNKILRFLLNEQPAGCNSI